MIYSALIGLGFDLCAIVICIIIMCNYYSVKRKHTRTEMLFQTFMWSSLFAAVMGVLSLVFNQFYPEETPLWLRYMARMLMVISVHGVGIVFMIYAVAESYENRNLPKSVFWLSVILIVADAISIAIYGCTYVMPVHMSAATYPAIINVMFVCHYFALTATAVYMLINRRFLRVRKQVNILFFIVFNLVATIVQFYTNIQISDFAFAVSVMLIYATLRRPEDELEPVTGAFNGKALKDFLAIQLHSGRSVELFVCEIKNMPVINSVLGHVGGEAVLKELAERLSKITGKVNYLYCIDGSKFAVLFNDADEYKHFKGGYIKAIGKKFFVSGTIVPVDMFACLIRFPEVGGKISDVDSIMKYYRDNSAGGGIIEASKEAVMSIERSEKVGYAVQKALENNGFEVYYQPIYEIKTRKFSGCEALVRLNDPEWGFISPNEFIPLAEKDGTIVDIGRQVVSSVCRFIGEDKPQRYGVRYIDINLSIIQCLHPDIIEELRNILGEYGVPVGMITFEITETASSKEYKRLHSNLEALHASGYKLSLDDFGTGFSSMEFLINFPFDVVKLDKSLVTAYMDEPKYETILQHYMPMLHGLGVKIVAEGVETMEMVRTLDKLGCDYLQGYYFSRPVSRGDYLEFVRVKNA